MSRRPVAAVSWSECAGCGKRGYPSARVARKVAKLIPGPHMTAYRCLHNDAIWHLGHLPRSVVRGREEKAAFVERCERRQGRAS